MVPGYTSCVLLVLVPLTWPLMLPCRVWFSGSRRRSRKVSSTANHQTSLIWLAVSRAVSPLSCRSPHLIHLFPVEDLNPRSAVIMQDILTHFFESKVSPPYTAVLLIDQKIRDIGVATHIPSPSVLSTVPLTQTAIPDEASSIYCRGLRSVLLLALHRTYFSHAISRPNENPVTGRMGKSIIAVYGLLTRRGHLD